MESTIDIEYCDYLDKNVKRVYFRTISVLIVSLAMHISLMLIYFLYACCFGFSAAVLGMRVMLLTLTLLFTLFKHTHSQITRFMPHNLLVYVD